MKDIERQALTRTKRPALFVGGELFVRAKLGSLRIHREQQVKTKTAEELYALADRLLAAVSAVTRFDGSTPP